MYSRGTLRLRSSDPWEQPSVDLHYLSNPRDRDTLIAGIRLCMHIVDEMRKAGYLVTPYKAPKSLDDADLDDFIAHHSQSFLHYSSTCRMAPLNDPEGSGVVDDELRVHGIANLRVCDASISPQVPAAHLQAPCVAVAEKCADMMKAARYLMGA
jgi:choline dehydrogenase